jgi:RNA polymerase sigma factor (sigma-70 family)
LIEQQMKAVTTERAIWLGNHILQHEPALRAWLRGKRLVGIEVDDIVQETYAVLASLASVDHVLNPRNYAFQTAHSLIKQHVRRARVVSIFNVGELGLDHVPSDQPWPDTIVSDRQDLLRLAEAIDVLPPRCREAFVLRKLHDLSQREIAARMGLTESTVEKHLSKAVEHLMRWFGRDGGKEVVRVSNRHVDLDLLNDGQTRDKR